MDVVADRGADALHLVGGDRGADAGAADHDAARGFARCHLLRHGARDVGEIHRLVVIGTHVEDVMAEVADVLDDGLLERPAGVVGSDDETHVMPFLISYGSWQPRAAVTIVSGLSYAYPAAARRRGTSCRSH